MFRRERDARRTAKSIRTHEETMEAFRRTVTPDYNPDYKIDYSKPEVFVVNSGGDRPTKKNPNPIQKGDVMARSPRPDDSQGRKQPAKYFRNNVRKVERWEKNNGN